MKNLEVCKIYTSYRCRFPISNSLTKTSIRGSTDQQLITLALLRPYLNSQNYGELFSSQIIWFVDDTNVYLGFFFFFGTKTPRVVWGGIFFHSWSGMGEVTECQKVVSEETVGERAALIVAL